MKGLVKMKAILVNDDKTLRWADVPNPVIKDDEVLVKIAAAAVNRADLMQREGNYPPPQGCPEWMGLEISGEIVEVGGEVPKLSAWKCGDKVCALLGGGGYAEYAAVKYDMLMPVPEGCSLTEAAAIPEAFATSYLNLFIEGRIKPGNTLLVTGGNSGLASVMLPMARAFGCRTVATVRGADKAKAIEPFGADLVIDTKAGKLSDALSREASAGRTIDVAIDCVGGEDMGDCLPYMTHGGRWIMIAALAGFDTHIDLKNIYVRNVRIIGSTLRSRAPEVKAKILAELVDKVWSKIESGDIRPTIYKVLPITEAEKAHALLYNSESVGKVVLTVK